MIDFFNLNKYLGFFGGEVAGMRKLNLIIIMFVSLSNIWDLNCFNLGFSSVK